MQEGTVAQVLRVTYMMIMIMILIMMMVIDNDNHERNDDSVNDDDDGSDDDDDDNDDEDDDTNLSPFLSSLPPVYWVTRHVSETTQAGKNDDASKF